MSNAYLTFRPLRSGSAIINPRLNQFGTLGFFATSDGQDRWIISCYHVLCRTSNDPFSDGEEIYQPMYGARLTPIARIRNSHAHRGLDIAGALVEAGIEVVNEVLGVGEFGKPKPASIGMKVAKFGLATGLTEGLISEISGDQLTIEVPKDFPVKYHLSEIGDSGAVWYERESRRPVGIHLAGNDTGVEKAYAISIFRVLDVLSLTAL